MNDTTDTDQSAGTEAGPSSRDSRFPPVARWTVVFVIVMIALIVAIWPRGEDPAPMTGTPSSASGPRPIDAPVDEARVAEARQAAALPECPVTGLPESPDSVLEGVVEPCLGTGAPYDLGASTAGRPLVINVWAQWCGPCKTELPYFEEFAARAGDRVTVLALHAKEGGSNPFFPLTLLTEIGVRLPSVLDLDGKVAAAIGAPRVFPSTVFLRPDGTVAEVYPGVFDSPEEIADSVAEHLGVRI
ncbi:MULTISPECIES: TlpA family protein disulfide reductase [Gordonia]|uniref:TlpA family protein disulfide reductase n=1 Tax=Gordonia TaxID=2053 RepID=UPI001EF57C2F|nr:MULTISPECIES: TlpA disulfide reductase family protein [Gordonia]MCG7633071.1 TlpA family protein disulfide reductase [Gordonia sp. McavH-238-E]UPW09778.1 TlpA family protein disulfide reductase [Gordonia terrae]